MILGAGKKAIIANPKLKVFEEAQLEQELERDPELPSLQVPRIKHKERTSQWVDSSHRLSNPPPTDYRSNPRHTQESSHTTEQSKLLSSPAVTKRPSFSQDPANQLSGNEDESATRHPL